MQSPNKANPVPEAAPGDSRASGLRDVHDLAMPPLLTEYAYVRLLTDTANWKGVEQTYQEWLFPDVIFFEVPADLRHDGLDHFLDSQLEEAALRAGQRYTCIFMPVSQYFRFHQRFLDVLKYLTVPAFNTELYPGPYFEVGELYFVPKLPSNQGMVISGDAYEFFRQESRFHSPRDAFLVLLSHLQQQHKRHLQCLWHETPKGER